MTEEVMEQVREKIVPIIRKLRDDTMNAVEKQEYLPEIYPVIRAILSIPEILIKDPDQSLPEPRTETVKMLYEPSIYGVGIKSSQETQQDMLKEHWVKVLPKELNV